VPPYDERSRERDTVNATDGVLRDSGGDRSSFCSVKEEVDRYLASLVVGVDRTATGGTGRDGPPPGPPPPGPPPPEGPGPAAPRPRGGASLVPGVAKAG
jgi:hypothetical protein